MTHPPAPALTAEEARTVARFDAAVTPPEVVAAGERQEAMARALWEHDQPGATPWAELFPTSPSRDRYRRLAAAAIAADPSPAEEAFDLEAACQPVARQPKSTRTFRVALASPAPAPQGEEGQR